MFFYRKFSLIRGGCAMAKKLEPAPVGPRKWWVVKKNGPGEDYFSSDDGTLLLFSSERRAQNKMERRGFSGGVLVGLTKAELSSRFGADCRILCNPQDGAKWRSIAIVELFE